MDLANERDVKADPTTEVMAALHNTSPKILYPTFPAALRKTTAAGFSLPSEIPCHTIPSAAINNRVRMTEVISIAETALLVTCRRFSSPVIPASKSLQAPAELM